jgi:Lamin Tail Domain
MKRLLSTVFVLCALIGEAQVSDNFADGDFTSNPVWTEGSPNSWTLASNKLRSNVSVPNSTFYITTPSAKATNAQWEFTVNLQFNTSSANYVDVYLTSSEANLTSSTNNGYFVRIGETPDEISLYKRTAGLSALLINGQDGTTNTSNSTIRIKVTRDANNLWTLERDVSGIGDDFFTEGTETDNSFTTSSFFGIRVTQSTASFHNKHFFDDISVGDIILDTTPPLISSVTATSANTLSVVFNEKLQETLAEQATNYAVNKGIGTATTATLQPDEKTVLLTFANTFANAQTSTLTIVNVVDKIGNSITTATQDFFYFNAVPAQAKDIIVTEIFADPSPVIGLPEAEFIEIYNRTSNAYQLNGWQFTDGSSIATLPSYILLPNSYLIVCSSAAASQFATFGNVLGVANFPTLNNSGDALVLRDALSTKIDSANYALSWYNDTDKQEGGWSLELIDKQNICAEETNWLASEDVKGGTPGTQNSVDGNKPDLTAPRIVSAISSNSQKVILSFNEKLEIQIPPTSSFSIEPSVSISSITFADQTMRGIELNFAEPLQENTLYTITLSNVFDCAGNQIDVDFNQVSFALPLPAAQGDVVINEILFNPRPNAVDFVEIYNRSDKFINLKDWKLGNIENDQAISTMTITNTDVLIAPRSYKVFTTDPLIVKNEYPQSAEENFFETSLPSMNDDEGSIAIVTDVGVIMDAFNYTDELHSLLLKDDEGVSLEKVDVSLASFNLNNWKSGVGATGFATPGYLNANSKSNFIDNGAITIDPEIFESVVGQPNFTQILYSFDRAGYTANAKIFDAQGRLIKKIATNEILAPKGFFTWDGAQDDGTQARIGYYTLWLEVYDTNGAVKTFRKRIVVAAKF